MAMDHNSGPLALKNIQFLVSDGNLTYEDLLNGLPVLQHLSVDTKIILKDKILDLDGTDCGPNGLPVTKGGQICRLMISRLNRVPNNHMDSAPSVIPDRSKVNYFTARAEGDPFPDPSLLDPSDQDHHEKIKAAIDEMRKSAQANVLPEENRPTLAELLPDHIDIFQISFSL